MTLQRLCVPFLLLFMAAGCESVHYEYKAPSSSEGRQCVVQCASIKEQCRSNETSRVQAETRTCERRAESTYRACLGKNPDKKQVKECDERRIACYGWENFNRCEEEYKQCFTHCGGVVEKVITKH